MNPIRRDPGCWMEENVFSAVECDLLIGHLAEVSRKKKGRAGARHLMVDPVVSTFARDSRLLKVASVALGPKAIPFRATLFEKTNAANWFVMWHQDTALPLELKFDAEGWGPWSRKEGIDYAHAPTWALDQVLALRVSLDASTEDNGPLCVIPDSHSLGVMKDEEIFAYVRNHESKPCLTGKGGVVAMRPLTIHSSAKARSDAPRRVLHIEYASRLDISPHIRLAIT
jgi:ectoine hydroxylase-related dioxygenase (phytanoyl-CoA dioxygenase family)